MKDEARQGSARVKEIDSRRFPYPMIGVKRAHRDIPQISPPADVRQVPLVEFIRTVLQPLRVGNKAINAAVPVHLVKFGIDLANIGPASGCWAGVLHNLSIGGIVRIISEGLQIRHYVLK